MLDLTVSIIDTNNRELTLACLRSLHANTHRVSFETFVVDNACTDGSAEAIAAEFPQVRLIHNSQKLGFSTNNDLVFRHAQGRYFLLLNDDTIVQPSALDTLVEFMDSHPKAGAAGARLLNPDGTIQPSFAGFPGLADFYQPVLTLVYPERWALKSPTRVDSVNGACMMVRREAAIQVGLLDTDFDPLYAEEREWCFRIRRAGWEIYHVPSAQIVHYGSQTSKRSSEQMTLNLYKHRLLFCRKHYSRLHTVLYQVLLFLSALPKIIWWTLAYLSGMRKRMEAKRRLQCHIGILKVAVKDGNA